MIEYIFSFDPNHRSKKREDKWETLQESHKKKVINEILDNPVYMPQSGMRVDLAKALMKLSLSSLRNLNMIIHCKENKDGQ